MQRLDVERVQQRLPQEEEVQRRLLPAQWKMMVQLQAGQELADHRHL